MVLGFLGTLAHFAPEARHLVDATSRRPLALLVLSTHALALVPAVVQALASAVIQWGAARTSTAFPLHFMGNPFFSHLLIFPSHWALFVPISGLQKGGAPF